MDRRCISEEFSELAAELIKTEPELAYIAESEATIMYLTSENVKMKRGRRVFGECEKVPDKWKWAVPCDFTITIFLPNVERFTKEQLRILMLHELKHVGITKDGNEETYSTVDHDIEDFRSIIDRYGLDWSHIEQT